MTGKDKKSLKFSYFSGVFGGGMAGFTADYFTPFALLLGATARQVGFLNALPNFFAASEVSPATTRHRSSSSPAGPPLPPLITFVKRKFMH